MIPGFEGDKFGPEKIVQIRKPAIGLEAAVVIDNCATGPSIGGIRMAPDVTLEECARLARAMTWKNAAAGLPHGGGKAVIKADPSMPDTEKAQLIRSFAQSIASLEDYIPGPDMGTNEIAMAWIIDEIGRAVGLPAVMGGIPLDEIGVTGYGLKRAIEAAEPFSGIPINGARLSIQGFGAVGKHAARFLAQDNAILVAASDSSGTISNTLGLDVEALCRLKEAGGKFCDLADADVSKGPPEEAIIADCDILIPAARPDVINARNESAIRAKMIVEGANIPATLETEIALSKLGVLIIPDFIANAGGVICASVEYHGGTENQAISVVGDKIARNVRTVLERAQAASIIPREAAAELAHERVEQAMSIRRFG